MLGLLLRRKYSVLRVHHERLRSNPDPARAVERFEHRYKEAVIVNRVRLAAYVLAYSGAAFALISLALERFAFASRLGAGLNIISGVTSSLTVVAFATILVCNRFLTLVDLELGFLSAESRMKPRSEPA